jgi:hypothetical protein
MWQGLGIFCGYNEEPTVISSITTNGASRRSFASRLLLRSKIPTPSEKCQLVYTACPVYPEPRREERREPRRAQREPLPHGTHFVQ